MRKEKKVTWSIKEGLRIIVIEIKERKYIKIKYSNLYEMIDIQARNAFNARTVTTLIINYSYGFN